MFSTILYLSLVVRIMTVKYQRISSRLLRKAYSEVGHKEVYLDKARSTSKNIYLTRNHGSSWFQEFCRFYLMVSSQ